MKKEYNKFSPKVYSKKLSIINIIILLTVLIFFCVMFFVLPKETKSEEEKRELATISPITVESIFSGKTASEITAYVSDHFPFRSFFIACSDALEDIRGFKMDDITIHGAPPVVDDDYDIPEIPQNEAEHTNSESVSPLEKEESKPSVSEPMSESSSKADEISSEPQSQSTRDDIDIEKDVFKGGEQQGYTFIYKDRAMSPFGGGMKMGAWYASVLNEYSEALGDSVQIYNIVAPTSVDFYIPDKYRSITQEQRPRIQNIYDNLDEGIKSINVYDTLNSHKDEYIYFRTDHHWTGLGAYYAYVEFSKVAGFTPIPLESFTVKRLDDFLGTLYSLTKDKKLKAHPDYVDYYMIDTPYSAYRYMKDAPFTPIATSLHGEYAVSPNSYSVFLHGDFPLIKIETEINNGRRIAVVKESYGNAFVPFLVNHYEEVYVVDERYFQLGFINFIKENEINELLFINNIMAAHTPYHIRNIENIMYQEFVTKGAE